MPRALPAGAGEPAARLAYLRRIPGSAPGGSPESRRMAWGAGRLSRVGASKRAKEMPGKRSSAVMLRPSRRESSNGRGLAVALQVCTSAESAVEANRDAETRAAFWGPEELPSAGRGPGESLGSGQAAG
jgi:hypothetical protein